MAVTSLNFFHRPPDTARAPKWLRRLFFEYLNPLLYPWRVTCGKKGEGADLRRIMDCNGDVVSPMKVPTYHSHQAPPSPKLPAAATRRLASHHESCGIAENALIEGTMYGNHGPSADAMTGGGTASTIATCPTCNSAIRRHMGNIAEDLHTIIEDRQEEDDKEVVYEEWKKIAHAFDRFGLFLFIIATIILAIILTTKIDKSSDE